MSTDEENDALPQEDYSTAAEAAPKKRATKKVAKKATKKPATPKSAVAKDLSDTVSDTFTPGEIALCASRIRCQAIYILEWR